MKNKIIAVVVVISLIFTALLTVKPHKTCEYVCMQAQSIVRVMTSSTITAAHSCEPCNHDWQEYAITIKMYKIENPADYMDGLTAISKRCIYVGEAEHCRLPVKFNL